MGTLQDRELAEQIENLKMFIQSQCGSSHPYVAAFNRLYGAYLINKKSSIDNRKIKSATPGSLSGLNYDSNGDNEHTLLLTDRNGNEHPMKLDKNNTAQLKDYLQSLKFK